MSELDVVAVGRAGLDLYAEQVGVPFQQVQSFAAYVGRTPANIVVGARRLGLRTVLLTVVSSDPVGDFILHFLNREGVQTRYIYRKPGLKFGMVLVGIDPPARFPHMHFRENSADHHIAIADVAALPDGASKIVLVAGTNLRHSPGREATLFRHGSGMLAVQSSSQGMPVPRRARLWMRSQLL